MSLSLTLDGQPVVGYSNLQIKSISPGGFASVTFNMNRKLDRSLLATFTDCLVYDTATGEQVGGGRLLEQGRNDDGTWGIVCLGEGLASMQDRTEPYFLVDTTMDQWVLYNRTSKRLDGSQGQPPGVTTDDPTLLMTTTEDKSFNTGASVTMVNRLAVLCGQSLGGMAYEHTSGDSVSTNRVRGILANADLSTETQVFDDPWSTFPSSRNIATAPTDFSSRSAAVIRWRSNSGVTGDETMWSSVYFVRIWARPYDKTGALTSHTSEFFTLSEAFVDVVARFCPRLDQSVAAIATTTNPFDQLAWPAGISAMGVMDEMMKVDTKFTWHVWQKMDSGKWLPELAAWPTTVRYEASVDDGFSAPTPTSDLYTDVAVTWTTANGRDAVTRRSQSVPDLDAAGIKRSTTIQLGNEQGSTANAGKAGDQFLDTHEVPPNAGTLTISAGTLTQDNLTGRFVKPWHIRPNELIRVRGVQPTPDTLNATSPDGVTVFRIVSMTYDDDSGLATLELDTQELTPEKVTAQLIRKRFYGGPTPGLALVTQHKR